MLCEKLQSHELEFNEVLSSQCLINPIQSTVLYDRTVAEKEDEMFDIQLPFPFRWFGNLYDEVFVGSNSYVTFGGKKIVFANFNAFNPPLPSVLIAASDNNMRRLTVGWVPEGWLVRFEGMNSPDDDEIDENGMFVSSPNLVWELLFLQTGSLQLCTGMVIKNTEAISAVSHQKSASLARAFVLNPNSKYLFTTTCATENRISLSAPISFVTGVKLNIVIFLSLSAITVSLLTVTLRGSGFSCPPNATVSLMSSPPTYLAFAVANIIASNSSSPVLIISGIIGTNNGSTMMSFIVPGVSTPYQPQDAFSNLDFAICDIGGGIISIGNNITLDAVMPCSALEQTPLLELSVPTIRSQVSMKITVSPDPLTFIFGQSAPKALLITISGSGWHFDSSSATSWTTGFGWKPISASITSLDTSTHKIRVDFDISTSQTISDITPLMVIIPAIQTPNFVQGSLSNIKCSILNDHDSILASGSQGKLAALTSSELGLREPAISFSPPLKSVNGAVLEVKLTPVFRIDYNVVPQFSPQKSFAAVVITLFGQGISCSANTNVRFFMPFVDASAVANIDSSIPMFPVLHVTITSGSFASGLPIWFQVSPVNTPHFEQPDFGNVSTAMIGTDYFGNPVLVAASVSGTIDRIVDNMGANKPVIRHSVDSGTGRIELSFTPSALLPANSVIIITLTGVGLTASETLTSLFVHPTLSASGKASIINEPLNSVLIVSVPGAIFANTNVTISVSPVVASVSSNLSDVRASVVDEQGKILVASVSGSFSSHENAVATVQDFIMSAVNGTVTLPPVVFAGKINCNNVINETIPRRAFGLSVVLTSSGSKTSIDCSSTNMRCLVVYRSSITIIRIRFRGGSSVAFVFPSTLRSIRALYEATQAAAPVDVASMTSTAIPSFEARRMSNEHSKDAFNRFDIKRNKTHEGGRMKNHDFKKFRASRRGHSAVEFRENHAAALQRRLLQSSNSFSALFKPDYDGCGGCVFVDAPGYIVWLQDVTFLGCNAIYGGGGFFNVSEFNAAGGLASRNTAQQGGGFFVLSSRASNIRSFLFEKNNVVTFLPSRYKIHQQFPQNSPLETFLLLHDSSAAAGGGAWFQLLGNAENCTFSDNTALAAGTSDTPWKDGGMIGSHALGSGMFVVETRSFVSSLNDSQSSTLVDLVFRRCQQLCAGWCVAGGALFISLLEGGTSLSRFVFESTVSAAISSELLLLSCKSIICVGPSVALGSCLVIADTTSNFKSTTISYVRAESVSSRAVGSIYGGCMTFLNTFSNVEAQNISVSRGSFVSVSGNSIDHGGIYGGVLFILNSENLRLFRFFTDSMILRSNFHIFGGVMCIMNERNSVIMNTSSVNVSLVIKSNVVHLGNALIRGGVFYVKRCSNTQIINTFTLNLHSSCNSSNIKVVYNCKLQGGVVFVSQLATNFVFSVSSTQNSALLCHGAYCFAMGGVLFMGEAFNTTVCNMTASGNKVLCSGINCTARGMLCYVFEAMDTRFFGVLTSNMSLSCIGSGSHCFGGYFFVFLLKQSPMISNTSNGCTSLSVLSDIHSSNFNATCHGQSCFVIGGIAYFEEAFCLSVRNAQAHGSSMSAFGNNSRASGSIFGIAASNSIQFTRVWSTRSTLLASGDFSQALGGAVSLLSGNLYLNDCIFLKSTVRCSGVECVAIGGVLSAVSTLIENSNYNNFVSIFSSSFTLGAVICSGQTCSASGGAIAAGISNNASQWIKTAYPRVSKSRPPKMRLRIINCTFEKNSASSSSIDASATGGAIAIQYAESFVSNSTFSENFITSDKQNAIRFAGGGALYIAQADSKVIANNCSFTRNNATSDGLGGALLVLFGAILEGWKLSISQNHAGKGGCIFIDTGTAYLYDSHIHDNSASVNGGGLFCSNKATTTGESDKTASTINLIGISFRENSIVVNSIVDPLRLGGTGADLFIVGSVNFSADSATKVSMKGNYDRDVTPVVVSVVTNSSEIFLKLECRSGTMLRYANVTHSSLQYLQNPPSDESMQKSACFPSCVEVPKFRPYVANSGFLASCTPCPRGSYNLGMSILTNDTVANFCLSCPFGASCDGGDVVTAQESYWGWKVSESSLTKEFLLLPEGYGCKEKQCKGIDSCGGNRSSVLCGGCIPGYSAAFFTKECVADDECSSWKLWILSLLAFVYALLYSIFLRYSSETPIDTSKIQSPTPEQSHPVRATELSAKIRNDQRSSAFHVLMWYYQLAGLLLSMPNPLKFFDGESVILNIIGLIFGTVPVSQVFSMPSLVFCTKAGSTATDIHVVNVMFYALWAAVLSIMSFERVWLPVFRLVHAIINAVPEFWDNYENACEAMGYWGTLGKLLAFFLAMKWTVSSITLSSCVLAARRVLARLCSSLKTAWTLVEFSMMRKNRQNSPQISICFEPSSELISGAYPREVRGQAWLNFGVTAYSAVLSLMVQCTTCVTLPGYQDQGVAVPQLRWFYDGRIVCFSDSGELPGVWQIAALVAVVVLVAMPCSLAVYMNRASLKTEASLNIFDKSALSTYFGSYNASNKHWFAVMFYHRIVLSMIISYTVSLSMPFIRGISAWFVCFIILVMEIYFKPYSDPDLQHLSSICCLLLVTISSVLLRSQTLLSSARTINFDPIEPDLAASTTPLDVQVCIFVILSCLVLPFVWLVKPFEGLFACILLVRQKCRPSEQPNQLHQHSSDQKSLSDTIQMDALEGLEMTGLPRRDKAAAGNNVTSEVACDEKMDPKMNHYEGISIQQKIALARGSNFFVFERAPHRYTPVAAAVPQDPAFKGVGEFAATQLEECGHELAQMKAALVWQDALRDLEQIRQLSGNDYGSEPLSRGAGNQMNSSRKLKSGAPPPPQQSATMETHPPDGTTVDQC